MKHINFLAFLILLFFLSTMVFSQGIIIDHECADNSKIPNNWINNVKAMIKLHYAHTSHGEQLTTGIERLANPSLTVYDSRLGYTLQYNSLPSASNLCIMDGQLSETYIYPDLYWQSGGDYYTRQSLNTYTAINVSMWAWCSQLDDYSATEVNDYLSTMSTLESLYPNVTFVYMTGNAQSTGDDGYNRYLRNQQIRQFCRDNNKVLFDFADLDAWYGGVQATYYHSGSGLYIPCEHPQYNGDQSGHTTYSSCENKGRALWWLLARIAGWGASRNDFNGDGQGDILWRNYGNGANAVWYLQSSGSTAGFRQGNLQSMTMEPGQEPAQTFQNPWEAAEILYKDERVYHSVLEVDAPQEKIDVNVYRDALEAGPVFYRPGAKGITGDIQELMMPGDHKAGVQAISILSTAYLNTISNTGWHIEATGDLNGDGNVDILWRHYVSGQNAVWYMNGSVISGTAYLTTITDTLWRIEGAADFNGDGNTDLLWRHYGSGQNALWYMYGVCIIGTTYLDAITDTNWRIEATGDFNGDGYTDFVWRNYATGQNALWYMSGSTHTGTVFLTAVADVYWAIAGAGDFNRDGKTDLLWRHYGLGANSVWYMSGTTITGTEALIEIGDQNWKIENH